jgi:hypothetical protein
LIDLFDLLRAGAFPHTSKEKDCSICDFAKVCGGADLAGRRAERKLGDDADNAVLLPYRRLNPS